MFNLKTNKGRIKLAFVFSFISVILSFCLAKPKIEEIRHNLTTSGNSSLWTALEKKKKDLSHNMSEYASHTGESKYVLRLTAPIIMKIFDLNRHQMFGIQIVLGYFNFFFWALISFKLFKNSKTTLLLCFGLASCYYGKCFYIDSNTPVNTISIFLVTTSIYFSFKHWYFLIPSLFALFFADERGIVAFGVIGCFILFSEIKEQQFNIKSGILKKEFLILLGVFIISAILRVFLSKIWELPSPDGGVGLNIFFSEWKYLNRGLFSGVGGFYIPIILGLFYLIRKKYFTEFGIILLVIFAFIITASFVSDRTKSITYIVPIGMLLLNRIKDLKIPYSTILNCLLIINVIYPTQVIVGEKIFYWYNVGFDFIFKAFNVF